MVQTEPVVEMVDEGDTGSETPEDKWESQWNDFGALPLFIPEFNVALAKFIIKFTGTKTSFPEIMRQEGGVRLYEQFVKVFDYPYPKILQILGGKVSTNHEKEIVKCIALATFLMLPEYSVLGSDGIPEYADFNQEEWMDHLSDNRRAITYKFCQALNIHVAYENICQDEEYVKAHGKSAVSKSASTNTTPKTTTRNLHFGSPITKIPMGINKQEKDKEDTSEDMDEWESQTVSCLRKDYQLSCTY
jgi:hypothetical protein